MTHITTSITYQTTNMTYHDDNYGQWNDDGEDNHEFYHKVQSTNVEKVCKGCDQLVNIQPQYAYCNSCAEVMERGGEF